MADTAVEITAGTGTNIDTRTEATNGNHRQVIVVGDPSTNAGVAPVSATQGLGVNVASGGIASGAVASGAIASGAVASGAIASGAFAAGSIAAGAVAAGTTSFVHLEDEASGDGHGGVACLAVEQTTPASTGGANGDYGFLQMSGGKLWVQTGAFSASATFTPAAASHVANDVNGGAQEFTSMGPNAGRVMITSATLEISGATAEATAWRLFLFNVTPPSAVADDGAHTLPSGDRASFLGFIDLGTAVDHVDTQWVEVHGINKQVKLAGTSLFGYLVNLTTLTPANVAHIVTLHAVAL